MSGVYSAIAIGGAAVIGAVSSRNASKRASETAKDTGDAQLAYMAEQEAKARKDIQTYIPAATDARNQGTQNALDMLSRGSPMTMDAIQQGNMGAQEVLAGSMPQIQNALMGGSVNYDFMKPREVGIDLQSLLSGAPNVYTPPESNANTPVQMPPPNIGVPGGNYGGGQVIGSNGGLFMGGFNSGIAPNAIGNGIGTGTGGLGLSGVSANGSNSGNMRFMLNNNGKVF